MSENSRYAEQLSELSDREFIDYLHQVRDDLLESRYDSMAVDYSEMIRRLETFQINSSDDANQPGLLRRQVESDPQEGDK